MKQGFDVIFQASLKLGQSEDIQFLGHSDYLRKVSTPSDFGDYSYEVWDAKLASHVKPYFITQLCCYAQMLEQIQGIRPKEIAVILGNGKIERLLTNDFYYYYLSIKSQFVKFHQNFSLLNPEEPANSAEYGGDESE